VSRALDLLAVLRLLPSPLISTWVYQSARGVAEDAERAAVRADRALGQRDEARAEAARARAAEQACYEREVATARRVGDEIKALREELDARCAKEQKLGAWLSEALARTERAEARVMVLEAKSCSRCAYSIKHGGGMCDEHSLICTDARGPT
jgi:hypothetical protein